MKTRLFWLSVVIFMAFLNCGGENNAPVIDSVAADPSSTYPGQDVTLTCDAEDEDDDTITYDWSAEAGTLSATDLASVTWTAPADTGHYVMEVIVEDEEGLADTGDVTVAVNPNWVYGENLTSITIGANAYTYSAITISGAPSGAIVDSVSIIVSINHPSFDFLDIWLESPDDEQLLIWDSNYPGGTQSFTTDFFAGGEVNGVWQLVLYSQFTTGTLNSWSITVFWGF
jgi:hypothetical protein